jgi:hypothetical protein
LQLPILFFFHLDDFEENGDDENATADQPEYEDLDQQDELEDLEIEPEGDLAENEEDDNEEDESDQGTPSQFSGI